MEDDQVPFLPSMGEDVLWMIHFALQTMADASDFGKVVYNLDGPTSWLFRVQ